KLNHLVKDVRQRTGNSGRQRGNSSTNGKIINMVYEVGKNQKRKCRGRREEDWMSALITFPSIPFDDVSDEPLIIEAEIEGYLVRKVFVDQGAAVQVMLEHCFHNLCPTIQARLTRTHTEGRILREQLLLIGKIELEVVFENEGCNLRVQADRKAASKVSPGDVPLKEKTGEKKEESPTEDVVINPAFPDQEFTMEQQYSSYRSVGFLARKTQQGSDTEVAEWLRAGIVRPVRYPTWISNPVLPDGERYDNGCDGDLRQPEEGQYEVKSEKCSFGVKKGKFLGYMVTSEGIRANPKKTKAVVDMQSPKTLREMQSLSGKLAALNRFLSWSAERAMPFFDTLKNITKENKDDFRWTEAADRSSRASISRS
ncbi:hypothetical protein Tco_1099193, partial [Tanacetum coccineum]